MPKASPREELRILLLLWPAFSGGDGAEGLGASRSSRQVAGGLCDDEELSASQFRMFCLCPELSEVFFFLPEFTAVFFSDCFQLSPKFCLVRVIQFA